MKNDELWSVYRDPFSAQKNVVVQMAYLIS